MIIMYLYFLLFLFIYFFNIYIMFPQAQELYSTLTGQAYSNVTLPMILSEWHKLYNNSMQFRALLQRLPEKLGGAYWTNWMPETSTDELLGALQQRSRQLLVCWSLPTGFHYRVLFFFKSKPITCI